MRHTIEAFGGTQGMQLAQRRLRKGGGHSLEGVPVLAAAVGSMYSSFFACCLGWGFGRRTLKILKNAR